MFLPLTTSLPFATSLWKNAGQGLGFVLMGIVIDKKTLGATAAKLAPLIAPLYSYVAIHSGGEEKCGLTAAQTSTIKSAMVGHNSSCLYNMTLSSILDQDAM